MPFAYILTSVIRYFLHLHCLDGIQSLTRSRASFEGGASREGEAYLYNIDCAFHYCKPSLINCVSAMEKGKISKPLDEMISFHPAFKLFDSIVFINRVRKNNSCQCGNFLGETPRSILCRRS